MHKKLAANKYFINNPADLESAKTEFLDGNKYDADQDSVGMPSQYPAVVVFYQDGEMVCSEFVTKNDLDMIQKEVKQLEIRAARDSVVLAGTAD